MDDTTNSAAVEINLYESHLNPLFCKEAATMVEKVPATKTNSATKIISCNFAGDNGHDKDSDNDK
jgi:hypothetical protein